MSSTGSRPVNGSKIREGLIRFQNDVAIVTDAAGVYHDYTMQMTLRALHACALRRATQAFNNAGDPLHSAWADLVSIVAEFLNCRGNFPPGDDGPERARLQMFVDENADISEQAGIWVRS